MDKLRSLAKYTVHHAIICALVASILAPQFLFAADVTFESDVRIKKEDQSAFQPLKGGTPLRLETGESALVSTSQGLPMLIYSIKDKRSKIQIDDANLNVLAQDQLRPALEKATNEIISGLQKVEAAIQRRDYDQALALVTPLKAKYPNIAAVQFASGSANYLTNRKSDAINDLEKGLANDPDNAAAKKLLAKLKGGS